MESTDSDEINLRELFGVFWKGRWLIVAAAMCCGLVGLGAAVVVKKQYLATVVVSPVSQAQGGGMGGLSSIASQFGGLASLAGISIGDDSQKMESIAVLQSEEITQRFIREKNLMPLLYADEWDSVAGKWRNTNPKTMPTLWKASQYFKRDIRVVVQDKKTGLYTLRIRWTDPELAAKWANELVAMTNAYLRARKIDDSERNITYLKETVAKTDMVPVQAAIYNVLEAEIKSVMMARGSEEFAMRVVDRAVPPEWPDSPKKIVWAIAGTLLGGIGAFGYLLLRHAWGAPRSQ